MAINLDCPRCKARLRVPNKKAGGYVNCPHCQGRFWVDKAAPSDATPADMVTMAMPPSVSSSVATPPVAPPPTASPPSPPSYVAKDAAALGIPMREAISPAAMPSSPPISAQPISTPPASMKMPPMRSPVPAPAEIALPPAGKPSIPKPNPPAGNSAPPDAPPVVSRPGRKVARFITAEAAQSSLSVAADGKLPELHLVDSGQRENQEKKSSSLSPLALVAILISSLVVSGMFLFLGDSSTSDNSEARAEAWKRIEENYFVDPAGGELKPYNIMLREAKRAEQARDRKTQRELFNKLLGQLRAERTSDQKGLTGSRDRDKKLEEYIVVLRNGLQE